MLTAFPLLDSRRRRIDPLGQGGDLTPQPCLIGVHQRHAAGQHHAQSAAQFVAHSREALSLRRLTLQAVHLPRDFFKNVVHACQVLFGALQAQLGQPLPVLEARNPRRFLDDGPPVVRLGAEQLADALLPDDGVALRSQARAHEDVLNIAQPAQLAVQQILALAGAEQAAGNHDLAFLRRALEFAAANLEHHRLRTLAGGECLRRFGPFGGLVVEHLAGLLVGDNLLDFGGSRASCFFFVPISGAFVVDCDLRLHGHRSLVSLRIDHGQRHLGHAQRFALAGSGKDHVLHVRPAQGLGALLAQHPTHRVQDVRLAAPVRPHHHGNARSRHGQFRAVAKAFEAEDVNLL